MDARPRLSVPDPAAPRPVLRADYAPPGFLIDRVDLSFALGAAETIVTATLALRRNPAAPRAAVLRLDGRKLEPAAEPLIDGAPIASGRIAYDADGLTLADPPDAFVLTLAARIRPDQNTELEGLYQSGDMLCTQCEAEGFRKIIWHLDRPDVLARFRVTIEADAATYPVLLANGNRVAAEDLPGGRRRVVWEDPFPKPAYLFALVAGRLERLEDAFVTRSGRRVALEIYARGRDIAKCGHAMESLKKAMRWDEEVYGLEYDLDLYMIVAVGDFNMGAMENKGLNIFNTKYVLASAETATDGDYVAIESVIAHEYFHNWTGNRVTCRDWFQLSLKEGLTVFRDQQFSADMGSAAVKRIGDVRALRAAQFPEDAGPLAHPVRPDSYVAIDNFYTATVYQKGAEVVRMYHTLLGAAGFRRGMDLYIARHDGQAATCDDFRAAMADANGVDLDQFGLWYAQAGTPTLDVRLDHDPEAATATLTIDQACPPTPGQPEKRAMHLPLRLALLDRDGRELPLTIAGADAPGPTERVLELRAPRETYVFSGFAERPVASLLRGFSAPVRLIAPRPDDELAFLFARDPDPFARWEAGQELMTRALLAETARAAAGGAPGLPEALAAAMAAMLADWERDPSFAALALTLPGEAVLGDQMAAIDVDAVHAARQAARAELGRRFAAQWRAVIAAADIDEPYRPEEPQIGRRAIKFLALSYLQAAGDPAALEIAASWLARGANMTDALSSLVVAADAATEQGDALTAAFAAKWAHEPLVLDKWLTIQALGHRPDALARVEALTRHPAYDPRNPNKIYALIGAFAGNRAKLLARDGAGCRFFGAQIAALDPVNPKVAARLAARIANWRRFDPARQALMRGELERLAALPGLSRDLGEVVAKGLA